MTPILPYGTLVPMPVGRYIKKENRKKKSPIYTTDLPSSSMVEKSCMEGSRKEQRTCDKGHCWCREQEKVGARPSKQFAQGSETILFILSPLGYGVKQPPLPFSRERVPTRKPYDSPNHRRGRRRVTRHDSPPLHCVCHRPPLAREEGQNRD